MERRHRLSRSRDFDTVYRHGRSTSTRFFTLHAFPREDADSESRLGLAIPRGVGSAVKRNRLKRMLREVWSMKVRGSGFDYVLVARPGLAEAVESRGFDWLGEQVGEVLEKAGS
ncbi:MAG TPA: ribonuclease P protein component [Gaiellaceae bacterium]